MRWNVHMCRWLALVSRDLRDGADRLGLLLLRKIHLTGHRVVRGVRGSDSSCRVAVACRNSSGEGCVGCGVCSALLLLPLPPLVLPPLLLQGQA